MHALLFRKWKQRVKGRDWYDMEWYIKKGVPLHLEHFLLRARNSWDWEQKSITKDQFLHLLYDKIDSTPMNRVREDIVRFIADDKVLDIWSADYFKDLAQRIKFK